MKNALMIVCALGVHCIAWCGSLPDPDMPVREVLFTAFDLETTGLVAAYDRVVEIGVVQFTGCGVMVAATNWLVHPGRAIPARATAVHGITDAMVEDAPSFVAVWPAFAALCEGTVLLAHNAPFDIRFVQMELERAGMQIPGWPVLDTLRLSRSWFPEAPSHAMERLVPFLGLPGEEWHRAMADCSHIVSLMRLGMDSRPDLAFGELVQAAGGIRWLNGRRVDGSDPVERESEVQGGQGPVAVAPCAGGGAGVCDGRDSRP